MRLCLQILAISFLQINGLHLQGGGRGDGDTLDEGRITPDVEKQIDDEVQKLLVKYEAKENKNKCHHRDAMDVEDEAEKKVAEKKTNRELEKIIEKRTEEQKKARQVKRTCNAIKTGIALSSVCLQWEAHHVVFACPGGESIGLGALSFTDQCKMEDELVHLGGKCQRNAGVENPGQTLASKIVDTALANEQQQLAPTSRPCEESVKSECKKFCPTLTHKFSCMVCHEEDPKTVNQEIDFDQLIDRDLKHNKCSHTKAKLREERRAQRRAQRKEAQRKAERKRKNKGRK